VTIWIDLVKKFSNFFNYMKKNKNKSIMPKKNYKKQDQWPIYSCYECGKQDHIKFDLLKLKQKFENVN